MTQMQFSSVSNSESGDYFQVLFEKDEGNLEADYFLVQCQFEFPEEEGFYIESKDTQFCGHFKIQTVTLSRQWLRLEMPSTKWKGIQIHFAADEASYEELARVLNTMFGDRLQLTGQNV